jgi:hypothetical protein
MVTGSLPFLAIKALASNVLVEHPEANVDMNDWQWLTDRRVFM